MKEEYNWLNFIKKEKKNFRENIYLKRIGFVSKETLNIKNLDNELCNIKVDTLINKFNNGISNKF